MTAANSTRAPRTITDPEAADYLADPAKAVYVYPFIGRERTAKEVADTYGVRLNALAYRLQQLQRLGLIEVTREAPRAGRPVKYYRAVADAFFVPLTATRLDGLEHLIEQWSQALQAVYRTSLARTLERERGGWGVRISREANGRLLIAPATNADGWYDYFKPDAPAILEGWFMDLRLDDADAKRFQAELAALYFRYLGRQGRRRYLIRMGLTPLPDEDALPPEW